MYIILFLFNLQTDAQALMGIDFFRSCHIFVGSRTSQGDIFFLKSDIK